MPPENGGKYEGLEKEGEGPGDGAATNATRLTAHWDHTSIIADGTNLLLK